VIALREAVVQVDPDLSLLAGHRGLGLDGGRRVHAVVAAAALAFAIDRELRRLELELVDAAFVRLEQGGIRESLMDAGAVRELDAAIVVAAAASGGEQERETRYRGDGCRVHDPIPITPRRASQGQNPATGWPLSGHPAPRAAVYFGAFITVARPSEPST